MKPTVVIGLGNPLFADEGIGVRVVERLTRHPDLPPGVEVLDLGTDGFSVLHAIEGRAMAVFVDCAFMDEAPGTMRRFTPSQAVSRKVRTSLSQHEGDLLHVLNLAEAQGNAPPVVVIFGVEPAAVEPGDQLTPQLAARLDEFVERVIDELRNTDS